MSAWLVDFGAQYGVDYAMHGVGQWKITGGTRGVDENNIHF